MLSKYLKQKAISLFSPLRVFQDYRIGKAFSLLRAYGTDIFRLVTIETITACNRRCEYCPNAYTERGTLANKQLLDEAIFLKVMDELAEIGFQGTLVPGFYGEPLLDPRLPMLLTEAKRRLPRMNITLITNADFLTVPTYQELTQAGVTLFDITLHGRTASKALREVFSYHLQHRAKQVQISCSIPGNMKRWSNRGGSLELQALEKKRVCSRPTEIIVIDYQGNMILCCQDYFSSVQFGNVRHERLMDIWRKPEYRKLRAELRAGIMRPLICQQCGKGVLVN